jgi:hypothetical protein
MGTRLVRRQGVMAGSEHFMSDTGPSLTDDTGGKFKVMSRELKSEMRKIMPEVARSLEFEHAR